MSELQKSQKNAVALGTKRGLELEIQQGDIEIPRAQLLQKMSEIPEGCKPGQIVNSITKQALPEEFVPVMAFWNFIRFNPRRADMPGFNPDFEPGALIYRTTTPTDEQRKECEFGEQGETPIAQRQICFLCHFIGNKIPLVISFGKTSFKAGKRLLSLTKFLEGDVWANKYKLSSESKKGPEGEYFIFKTTPSGKTDEQTMVFAEATYNAFKQMDILGKTHEEE